jgi:superfamily II DNA or RNA helicase
VFRVLSVFEGEGLSFGIRESGNEERSSRFQRPEVPESEDPKSKDPKFQISNSRFRRPRSSRFQIPNRPPSSKVKFNFKSNPKVQIQFQIPKKSQVQQIQVNMNSNMKSIKDDIARLESLETTLKSLNSDTSKIRDLIYEKRNELIRQVLLEKPLEKPASVSAVPVKKHRSLLVPEPIVIEPEFDSEFEPEFLLIPDDNSTGSSELCIDLNSNLDDNSTVNSTVNHVEKKNEEEKKADKPKRKRDEGSRSASAKKKARDEKIKEKKIKMMSQIISKKVCGLKPFEKRENHEIVFINVKGEESKVEGDVIHDEHHNIRPATYDIPDNSDSKTGSTSDSSSVTTNTSINTVSSSTEAESDKVLNTLRVPLYPHQRKVALHMKNNDSLLVIHATGTGKTLTTVATIKLLTHLKLIDDFLVATTKSCLEQFHNEFGRNGIDVNDRVMNHDLFVSMCKQNPQLLRNKLIVIDEVHKFTSKIHFSRGGILQTGCKALHVVKSVKHAQKVMLLTATPMVNSVSDLTNIWSMIHRDDFVTTVGGHAQLQNREKEMMDDMKHKVSYYHPKNPHDFPKVTFRHAVLEMDEKYNEAYENLVLNEKLLFWCSNPLPFYNGPRRAANITTELNSPKVKYTVDLIERNLDHGIIVFSTFLTAGVLALKFLLDEKKIPHSFISGETPLAHRYKELQMYNSGANKVLLISSAGQAGLDTRNTRHMVIFEPIWNVTGELQAIGRAARTGSHRDLPEDQKTVKIHLLYLRVPHHKSSGTMCFTMCRIKGAKQFDIIDAMKKLMIHSI